MSNEFLNVSEKFLSIQGEGQTMGIPSVFVRLGGCNLLCKSKEWICDSIEVWSKSNKVFFNDVLSSEDEAALRKGAHLIFTGGEPLLHQKKIVEYLQWFSTANEYLPIVEVETNGTIVPSFMMQKFVNYWNCSPKLSNSGEALEKRINEHALSCISKCSNPIFKFVISKESDLVEISSTFLGFIEEENIVLMPAGETQAKLAITRPLVAELCIKNGLRYSERLHIVIWNQKTGV